VAWACPVEIRGFEPRYPDMLGVDSVQALSHALAVAHSRIEDFIDKGGRVLDVGDRSEWSRRTLMAAFGATLRRRRAARRPS
jgi:hypothetical protein